MVKEIYERIKAYLPKDLIGWTIAIVLLLIALCGGVSVYRIAIGGDTLELWPKIRFVATIGDGKSSIPIGTVLPYYGTVSPPGYLLCNGAEVPEQYQELKGHLTNTNPKLRSPDGKVMLPDLQGYFLRGLDPQGKVDKEGSSRIVGDPEVCSTGKPKNRAFEISQSDAEESMHSHRLSGRFFKDGGDRDINWQGVGGNRGYINGEQTTERDGAHKHTAENWDSETRPINVALNFIIRAVN
ncbi:MAG: tail fiber protein [Deltaproteobacteria bacterium]|nr:tail fiber protein [Deltaproteobacteria bacterium]